MFLGMCPASPDSELMLFTVYLNLAEHMVLNQKIIDHTCTGGAGRRGGH